MTRRTEYTIKNSSKTAKKLLIEREPDPQWKAVSPEAAEKTRAINRFQLTAEPGKPPKLVIVEEREVTEEFALAKLEPGAIDQYIKLKAATPAFKKAFDSLFAARTKFADATAARSENEAQSANLVAEQARLRNNLQAIPLLQANELANEENKKAANELLQRYLKKLGDIETELENRRTELKTLKEQESKADAELENLLAELITE